LRKSRAQAAPKFEAAVEKHPWVVLMDNARAPRQTSERARFLRVDRKPADRAGQRFDVN